MSTLNQLLIEGLSSWIKAYHEAKELQLIETSNFILVTIDELTKDLSNEEQQLLESYLNGDIHFPIFESKIELENVDTDLVIKALTGEEVDEGLLSKAFGAISGFAIGPTIGKIIANALGVQKNSILYDFLTSRIVGSALGAALAKSKMS